MNGINKSRRLQINRTAKHRKRMHQQLNRNAFHVATHKKLPLALFDPLISDSDNPKSDLIK
ncbi:hypothetical protein [Vibrio gallicus]|uniref:hypothetical protein n=1 Tax=Vibrio gallicus TaxID=190897 RepID=UPI0021C355DC|nr:hypothetical protein [Vibrio gallicus]